MWLRHRERIVTMSGTRLEPGWERIEHALHLRDMCFKAFKNEDLCDLTLTSLPTNQSFLTHKVVIAAFSELWRGHVPETNVLKIEASPEEVKTLLKYMYTGVIDVNDSLSWEGFQRLVDQYQIYLSPKVQKKFSRLYRKEKSIIPWRCATCDRHWTRLDRAWTHAKAFGHHDVKCSKCRRVVPLSNDLDAHVSECSKRNNDTNVLQVGNQHRNDSILSKDDHDSGEIGVGGINEHDEDDVVDDGEDDWGTPITTMIMPELILQEEDPEMEEVEEEEEEEDADDHDDEEEDDDGQEDIEREQGKEDDQDEHVRNDHKAKQSIIFKVIKPKMNRKNLTSQKPPSTRKEQEQIRNKKKYLCSLCGSTLTGKTAYNRHQLIHTGKRPFSCTICGKTFTQNMRLTVHSRTHTGERPFLCSLCGKTFVESCKLNRHLQRVHMANKDGNPLIPGQPVINTEKFIMPLQFKRSQNVASANKKSPKLSGVK